MSRHLPSVLLLSGLAAYAGFVGGPIALNNVPLFLCLGLACFLPLLDLPRSR